MDAVRKAPSDLVLPHHNADAWAAFNEAASILRVAAHPSALRTTITALASLSAPLDARTSRSAFSLLSPDALPFDALTPGSDDFFADTVPVLVAEVLALPELFADVDIDLLRPHSGGVVELSYRQTGAVMAAAFFGLFPADTFSFLHIFAHAANKAKACGIVRYLAVHAARVRDNDTDALRGSVRWERVAVAEDEVPDWATCGARMAGESVDIRAAGSIEDDGEGMLQADFANRFLGGGVLEFGCVQEEIRLGVTNPQLLVGLLLCPEPMTDAEVILMSGSERFSDYKGYGRTTKWAGAHADASPRDADSGSFLTSIVAFDALPFRFGVDTPQFSAEGITRELNKAYAAFRDNPAAAAPAAIPIATGNWGCGAFGGDKGLKFLIQLMAAAAAGRPVVYFTFGDAALSDELTRAAAALDCAPVAVSDVFNALVAGGWAGSSGLVDSVLAAAI